MTGVGAGQCAASSGFAVAASASIARSKTRAKCLTWNDTHAVDVPEVDEEHRQIFRL
jgi:hypothetical protein